MELERRLRKVSVYHLALFALPLLSLLYYGWWTAGGLDERPDNPFRLSPMSLRGDIRSVEGQPLAFSQGSERLYPLKDAAGPLVGYHLRGRNQSGLEALLQSSLSPPAPPKSLWGAIAMDGQRRDGQPRLKGPNVELTIDAKLQQDLYEKFRPRAGVVVVADARKGDILAAVSGPSFDPNEIARDWQQLRNDPRSPLIERVGSGLYPVQTMQGTPLLNPTSLAAHPWLGDNPFPLYPGASSAVEIDGALLVSPLMLLQMVAMPEAEGQPPPLRLLRDGDDSAAQIAVSVPELGRPERVGGVDLFALSGPDFRGSGAFFVAVGRRQGGSPPLAFAVVVEGAGRDETQHFRQELLPVLEKYRFPLP